MVNQIALALLLIGQIALAGCVIYLRSALDKTTHIIEEYYELFKINRDLVGTMSEEQDKMALRIKVAEERIMNLQNKTGQISIQVKKLANNAVYEADNG